MTCRAGASGMKTGSEIPGGESTIFLVGDVYAPRVLPRHPGLPGAWIGNLEGPITLSPKGVPGKICLRAATLDPICGLPGHALAMSCANNHIMDFGRRGLEDTLRALAERNIVAFGAGTAENEYSNPVILGWHGISIGLCGYAGPETHPLEADGLGPAPLSRERVQRDIETARRQGAARVLVSVHWGVEECSHPAPAAREFARAMIGFGADIIVGHHSHCIQPKEIVTGRSVYYGLGNFLMPDLNASIPPGDGEVAAKQYRKRQLLWGREAGIVAWDLLSNETTSYVLRTTGSEGRCRAMGRGIPALASRSERDDATLYDRSVRLARWRSRAAHFAADPVGAASRGAGRVAGALRRWVDWGEHADR